MWLTCIISWPLGKLLDYLLGQHTIKRYPNDQLKYLILLHSKEALQQIHENHKPEGVEGLSNDEAMYIEGVLNFSNLQMQDVMVDISDV